MKRKAQKLEPLPTINKSQASYEKLMLQMMSKLVSETKDNNAIMREQFGKGINKANSTIFNGFKDRTNMPSGMRDTQESFSMVRSPSKQATDTIEEVDEPQTKSYFRSNKLKPSSSTAKLDVDQPVQKESKIEKVLNEMSKKLESSQELNKKLMAKIQSLEKQKQAALFSSKHQVKNADLSMIEKAITEKMPGDSNQKNSYVILSQILPYSDRRQMKVKFKISDLVNKDFHLIRNTDMKLQTSEWIGMVYRATASICWNMLLNNYLTFDEVKILFTENIVFNFIEFMNELYKLGKISERQKLTELINDKSVDVLDFLCKQYPQTKIEAPNITLRSLLPQIDNQGRIKYDLVGRSGIAFTYTQDGDYTQQIMKMINYMIDKTNDDYNNFFNFMRNTFEEVFYPIHKRKKMEDTADNVEREIVHEDLVYKEKVKSYTKYLIGRKISKNTSKYTDQEIEDGIFFVKSSGVLRIITKWVEELMEYFQNPEGKIKNTCSESKDHNGRLMYISALLKNGLFKQTVKDKKILMERIASIKAECYRMELLLTSKEFISDSTQVHLSQEQISVGKYCSNLKSAISSYICSQLNEVIHHLLKVPREVSEDDLGSELEDFKNQARKELDSLNLLTFKIFDLLRCKIHSNQEEIVWIVQYLLAQNKLNKEKFNIVRIKDRLNQGTRDIMINAQIQKGLVCQIQLSVTSNTDKKQQLLDQYNHFLYELKRSKLGPVTENVSIWSTLQQRFSYFQQLMKDKSKEERGKRKPGEHKCGNDRFTVFKRPIICNCCNNFYAIPQTCLLNVICELCKDTYCGECFYYNYLNEQQRKLYIFDKHRLIKADVLSMMKQYTNYDTPLPATGFFIKKKFLKKELAFYMAIEKNKNQKIKDAPSIDIIIVQTIVRGDQIINRQLNKKDIEARLENGQFYVKNYQKTQLNNYIIFYFEKKENKKLMNLKQLQVELHKPENIRTKILSIVREPNYISKLHLMKKDSQKFREMAIIEKVIKDDKIVIFKFPNLFILAQACVKGSILRAQIVKKVNTSALRDFADKESDIVMMEHKKMSTQLQDISFKMKPALYDMFCHNLKKLFLANGDITSIRCFSKFVNLEFAVISENCLTSLEGIEDLKNLVSLRFDSNKISSLLPLKNLTGMRYVSGNKNEIKSLQGMENLKELRSLSLYENQIESIEIFTGLTTLEELYLRGNPISDMKAIETMTSLRMLFIGNTKITQIPNLSLLKKLESVSLEFLNLDSIPNVFKDIKLTELFIAFNNINRIQNLETQTELLTLNLAYNNISKIENLQNLDKLEVLKLKNNNISVVNGVKDLDSLKKLNLKNNPIDDIDELSRFEITFKYDFTEDCLTERAKKQLQQLDQIKETTSEGDD